MAYKTRRLLPASLRKRTLYRRFTPATDLVSLRTLGVSRQLLFRTEKVPLHDIQSYSNVEPDVAASWRPAYRARCAEVQDISLIRLPRDTWVSGVLGFAVMADGLMVAEQQVEIDPAMLPHLAYAFRTHGVSVRVPGETLLIARYGEGTWGHWLGELLPKIAVCERLAPGRFNYVMADYVLQDDLLGHRLRESCAAYGVAESRFIRVPNGQQYSFDRLYAMTPVVTDGTMHPQVRRILREGMKPAVAECAGPTRLNLLRNDGRRSVANAEAVNAELTRRGFRTVDIAALSFQEQVAAFSGATGLFSVLGSGLTGLVYSPPEVRVAAAAPAGWADDFFYGILRVNPAARWAEVRGPVVNRHPDYLRFSSFQVDRKPLCNALDSLGF